MFATDKGYKQGRSKALQHESRHEDAGMQFRLQEETAVPPSTSLEEGNWHATQGMCDSIDQYLCSSDVVKPNMFGMAWHGYFG